MKLRLLSYLFCLTLCLSLFGQEPSDSIQKPTNISPISQRGIQPGMQSGEQPNKKATDKANKKDVGDKNTVVSASDTTKILQELKDSTIISLDSIGNNLSIDSLQLDSLQFVNDSLTPNQASSQFPPLPIADDGLEEMVTYNASDSIIYDIIEEKIYLYGNANVTQGQTSLSAARIIFDSEKQSVYAEGVQDSLGNLVGKPFFKDGTEEFGAEAITYSFKSKKGKLSQLITREGEGLIRSEQVRKNEYDELFGEHTYYTTCNHEHPHFRIEAEKVKIIPDELIVTGPAKFFIDDIPTPIVLPFGIFPLTEGRRSGILMPSYGYAPNEGYYLRDGGFYFGISEYWDLAVRGDLYSRGSWRLSLGSSYKKRYKYSGRLSVDFGRRNTGDPITDAFNASRDVRVSWTHNQAAQAHPYSTFSASVNVGTSSYDRNFISTTNNYLSNTLNSSINYSHQLPGTPFNISLGANHSQNTRTNKVNVTLPEVSLNMQRVYPFKRKQKVGETRWYEKIGMTYKGNLRNRVETTDSLFFKQETLQNLQNGVKHSIPITTSFNLLKYITVSPSFNYSEFWYTETTEKIWDPTLTFDSTLVEVYDSTLMQTITMVESIDTTYGQLVENPIKGFKAARQFNASVSAATRLYGQINLAKGYFRAFRHVVRPSLSFNWRPDFGADFWGYYNEVQKNHAGDTQIYSIFEDGLFGTPGRGKTSSVALSIDNNLEMKVRSSKNDTTNKLNKVKLLESLKLSTSYNFAADSLKLAPISLNARTTILNKIKINFTSTFNAYTYGDGGASIDKYEWAANRKLARLTRMNIGVNTSFGSKRGSSNAKKDQENQSDFLNYLDDFVNFNIPWTMTFGYNYNLGKRYNSKSNLFENNITQTINTSIDFSLTPKWKVNVRTGYDFVNKTLAYTKVDFYRDLHCWNMSLTWIPVGDRQSYEFVLRANSSLLKDLKVPKRGGYRFR